MKLNIFYRFLVYGFMGICMEMVFTGLVDLAFLFDFRLSGKSYLWMIPIWGFGLLCIEALSGWEPWIKIHWAKRAIIYCVGFFVIEASSGALIRLITGEVPWDYSGATLGIDGLIRLDYAPFWAVLGIILEKVCPIVKRIKIENE